MAKLKYIPSIPHIHLPVKVQTAQYKIKAATLKATKIKAKSNKKATDFQAASKKIKAIINIISYAGPVANITYETFRTVEAVKYDVFSSINTPIADIKHNLNAILSLPEVLKNDILYNELYNIKNNILNYEFSLTSINDISEEVTAELSFPTETMVTGAETVSEASETTVSEAVTTKQVEQIANIQNIATGMLNNIIDIAGSNINGILNSYAIDVPSNIVRSLNNSIDTLNNSINSVGSLIERIKKIKSSASYERQKPITIQSLLNLSKLASIPKLPF